MSAVERYRDWFAAYIPWWMSDRGKGAPAAPGNVIYRFTRSMIAPLDSAMQSLVEGLQAPWPGAGTPTALPRIGQARGILRGQSETDAGYIVRLISWLDTHRQGGSSERLARSFHDYLGNSPRVRVVNRSGAWVTVNADGTVVRNQQAWNWDGVSNPERAGHWWDQWIIVYPTEWAASGTIGDGRRIGSSGKGIGHQVTREEVDALKSQIIQWKSEHSYVRAAIWTSDATLFDPTVPGSLPDGTWGEWCLPRSDPRVRGGRNISSCRFWEP